MNSDALRRVATYLRAIERAAEAGDLATVAQEARLALHICEKADSAQRPAGKRR